MGEARGEAIGLGRGLQLLLEARFGTLPSSVISYISNSSDSSTLQNLMLSAYHVDSLQSFMELMKNKK